jgi:hypothetical protein
VEELDLKHLMTSWSFSTRRMKQELVSDHNQILTQKIRFNKNYKISRTDVQWKRISSMLTDRRMGEA